MDILANTRKDCYTDSYRRAGLTIARTPARYEVTPEQYEALMADPMVVTAEVPKQKKVKEQD